MPLQHAHILNPVTALAFLDTKSGSRVLLAGEGSLVKIFNADSSQLLSVCEVFDGQAVHGIAVRTPHSHDHGLQVAIWGGSSLNLLNADDVDQLFSRNVSSIAASATALSDWALDVSISPYDNDSCVLVTAHNTVLQVKAVEGRNLAVVKALPSPLRSILYSAALVWESSSEILVAAGTVFGEIIVWKCSMTGESQVMFTFSGHEGSIFGVDVSPRHKQPNGTVGRLLASCSDDRTIRIWDLATVPASDHPAVTPSVIRETGFGHQHDPNSSNPLDRCIASVMGHASRIWRVKFLMTEDLPSAISSVSLLSFGEDTTTQQWKLGFESGSRCLSNKSSHPSSFENGAGSQAGIATLSHVKTFGFHSGKHIWSTAISHDAHSPATLATGGADGKVSMYNFIPPEKTSSSPAALEALGDTDLERGRKASSDNYTWSIEDLLLALELHTSVEDVEPEVAKPNHPVADGNITLSPIHNGGRPKMKPKRLVKDGLNQYAFVSDSHVLVATNFGRILLGHIDANTTWSEVVFSRADREDLKSYTIMAGFRETGTVFMTGSSGNIYAYRLGSAPQAVGKIDGKAANMFGFSSPDAKTSELLVTTLSSGVATLFSVQEDTTELSSRTELALPGKFVVTSGSRINGSLILGARSGMLAFYDPSVSKHPTSTWVPPTRYTADAITSTIPLSYSASETTNGDYFLATERNGSYSIFSFADIQSTPDTLSSKIVRRVHHRVLPFGPLIERAWFQDGELFLYGFKSKSFVVWNETRQCKVLNVDCGGAHRSFAYSPSSIGGGGHFVYTKASRLIIHSQQEPSHVVVKHGGHGREIKCCAVSTESGLVATGAEDTAIRIWRHKDNATPLDSRLECLATLQKHTTGIQHLLWHGTEYLFSSGGSEELFVWAVQTIPNYGIGVVCEAALPEKSLNRDLRIMSFDVSKLPGTGGAHTKTMLLVSLAYSDSTMRIYTYSQHDGFILVAAGRYTASCLTQIRHLSIQPGHLHFLSAATDGILVLWKCDLSSLQVSTDDSGCTVSPARLDLIINDNEIIVASGGDDNALVVSIYPTKPPVAAPVTPKSFILRSAHSAAITGLAIVPGSLETGRIRIISSGNDQRVKEWIVQVKRTLDSNSDVKYELELSMKHDTFTSVADVGDLCILGSTEVGGGKALVVGNGIEVWNL